MTALLIVLSGICWGQAEAAAVPDPAMPEAAVPEPAASEAAVADAEAAARLGLEVRRLVRRLDADTLAEREAAERALIDLGPRALDQLPPVGSSASAEVKVRMDRVRQRLQEAAAQEAARGSRISLQGPMKLSQALAAIEQQSGNKIVDFRERFGQQQTDPTIETSFRDVPFWEVLDALLDQSETTVYNFSGQAGALAIVGRAQGELPRSQRAAYSGLFRFEGLSLLARRDLRNPENDSLRLTLEVAWEPRVAPIVLHLPLDQLEAVDENDRSLDAQRGPGRLEIPVQGDVPAAEIQIPFGLPDRGSRNIARLEGRLDALVPGRTHEFVFEQLETAKSVEQRMAGVTVTLEQVRKNGELYEVRVGARFDQADRALESHRNWVYNNEAYLVDAEGQRVEHAGMQATLQREDEVGVSYLFDHEAGLQGCRFVYKTPVLIVAMPVKYELKDIPLP